MRLDAKETQYGRFKSCGTKNRNVWCGISSGIGSPEGSLKGNPGDIYINTNGDGPALYVKEKGNDEFGWVGK